MNPTACPLANITDDLALVFEVHVNPSGDLIVSDPANGTSLTFPDPNVGRPPSTYRNGTTPATELGRVIGQAVELLTDLSM